MSKNKDIEKKLEKEIEKKVEKEFRKDKLEKIELKEKREIKEIKEFKEGKEIKEGKEFKEKPEKIERKEFKEAIKEKVEHKEIKEFEKQVPEKGGKELVEGGFDPGTVFTRSTASGMEATEDLTASAAAPKPKESDKNLKDIEKIKPEKENLEKVQKDIEKIKPEKEFAKHEIKEFKHEKLEQKELKLEKLEHKEFKVEVFEKSHQKELLPEKQVFENDPKGFVENQGPQFPSGDPTTKGPVFKASGTPEDRLAELEDAVTKLTHFIGVDLRPDLTEGALKGEADVAGGKTPDEAKPDDKNKKPGK
jgi:hypothetical protein